jgi:hypothetical protein
MSEFNFENNKELIVSFDELDFRPYGKVIGEDISCEESELQFNLQVAHITEVPKLFDFVNFGNFNLIDTEIPISDVQKIVRSEITKLVPKFNESAKEERKKYEDECEKVGVSKVLARPHLIECIQYKNINPFEWYIQVIHRNPPQLLGMRDDIYQFILKDKELYLNMSVRIYYTEKEDSKIYHISVSRCSGRSTVMKDFYRNLKDALERAEIIHNLLKEKR